MYADNGSKQVKDVVYLLNKAEETEDKGERLTVLTKAYLALDSILQYEKSAQGQDQ